MEYGLFYEQNTLLAGNLTDKIYFDLKDDIDRNYYIIYLAYEETSLTLGTQISITEGRIRFSNVNHPIDRLVYIEKVTRDEFSFEKPDSFIDFFRRVQECIIKNGYQDNQEIEFKPDRIRIGKQEKKITEIIDLLRHIEKTGNFQDILKIVSQAHETDFILGRYLMNEPALAFNHGLVNSIMMLILETREYSKLFSSPCRFIISDNLHSYTPIRHEFQIYWGNFHNMDKIPDIEKQWYGALAQFYLTCRDSIFRGIDNKDREILANTIASHYLKTNPVFKRENDLSLQTVLQSSLFKRLFLIHLSHAYDESPEILDECLNKYLPGLQKREKEEIILYLLDHDIISAQVLFYGVFLMLSEKSDDISIRVLSRNSFSDKENILMAYNTLTAINGIFTHGKAPVYAYKFLEEFFESPCVSPGSYGTFILSQFHCKMIEYSFFNPEFGKHYKSFYQKNREKYVRYAIMPSDPGESSESKSLLSRITSRKNS